MYEMKIDLEVIANTLERLGKLKQVSPKDRCVIAFSLTFIGEALCLLKELGILPELTKRMKNVLSELGIGELTGGF